MTILVAGVGNIFNGDDGFGCAVVRELQQRKLPREVRLVDFGIRGIDLSYALLDGHEVAILIDASARGGQPGELTLLEPKAPPGDPQPQDLMISAHDLDPAKVIRFVRAMTGSCGRLLILACEPHDLGGETGRMGLSGPVADAVRPAADRIERLTHDLLETEMA